MGRLEDLGWCEFFAQKLKVSDGFMPARVIAEHRNNFRVATASKEHSARIAGRMRHEAFSESELPAVGDWVGVSGAIDRDGELVIQQILPRKSKFSRKVAGNKTQEQIVAANVDFVWIVSSADQDFSLRRIERYLTLAWESGATPVIVLTKADKSPAIDSYVYQVETASPGTNVHATSCVTGAGIGELSRYFENHRTVALLGSSGVGKSTLINALAGTELQQTGEVRGDGKGRHTTTHHQLISLPTGGLIVDTPGMRELQLWTGESGLADTFGEIEQLANGCRFSDCSHNGEPGCAVFAAVEQGQLPEDRLHSYQKLQRELAHLERRQDVFARAEERRRHRTIHKSFRRMKKNQ